MKPAKQPKEKTDNANMIPPFSKTLNPCQLLLDIIENKPDHKNQEKILDKYN